MRSIFLSFYIIVMQIFVTLNSFKYFSLCIFFTPNFSVNSEPILFAPCKEFGKLLLVESGILGFVIRNSAQRIQIPADN